VLLTPTASPMSMTSTRRWPDGTGCPWSLSLRRGPLVHRRRRRHAGAAGAGQRRDWQCRKLLEVRDFINEGGRVLYTGQAAGSSTRRRWASSSATRSRTSNAATPPSRSLPGAVRVGDFRRPDRVLLRSRHPSRRRTRSGHWDPSDLRIAIHGSALS
jgi:hypothetical protein